MPKPTASKEALADLKFLQEQEITIIRERSLASFWDFLCLTLWPDVWEQHLQESLHQPIADKVTNAPPGARDLLLLPRRGRKTMMRTVAHTVWRITRDPNVRILVVSGLDATSCDMLDTIRRQFQFNAHYARIFPEMVAKKGHWGNQYEFTHPRRTNIHLLDPTVRSTYLGAPFAGRRCDILIMDDVVDDKHVATPDQADKSLRWVNALFPLIDDSKVYNMCFVNGTRKSFNDPYGSMLGEARGNEADKELVVGAVFDSTVRAALENEQGEPDINGEPIFDKVLTKEVLYQSLQQARLDANAGENWFWREFMNVCQSPESAPFLDSWFDNWTPVLPPVVWSGIVIDTAVKDSQIQGRGDFSVALVAHQDHFGNVYLTDGVRSDRFRFHDLARELLAMSERAGGVYQLAREKIGEDLFTPSITDYYAKNRKPCTVTPLRVQGQGKKVVRILAALQGPFQAKKIWFVGDGRNSGFPVALWHVIKDECKHCGFWAHDDAADALSLVFHKDVRVVSSANRSVPWTPLYRSRLIQGSTHMTNPAAVRMTARESQWQQGDGTLRPDPFVEQFQQHLGAGQLKRGPMPSLPIQFEHHDERLRKK